MLDVNEGLSVFKCDRVLLSVFVFFAVFIALATLIVSVDTMVPTITLTIPGFRVFCIIGIILFGNQLVVVPITSIGSM